MLYIFICSFLLCEKQRKILSEKSVARYDPEKIVFKLSRPKKPHIIKYMFYDILLCEKQREILL